jgi:gliding motility-associated-like protein
MFTKGRLLLIFFFFLLTFGHVKAQQSPLEGKSFWVTFIRNATPAATDLIVVSATNTIVTVENTAKGYSQSYTIAANAPQTISLPASVCVPINNNVAENFAVHVTSNDLITVYAINHNSISADATLVLPEQTCKSRYFVPSFVGDTGTMHDSYFVIVALHDSSAIKITPSNQTLGGQFPHVPYIVILNKGETYVETGDKRVDLNGSIIESVDGKTFAVFGGVDRTTIPDMCPDRDMLMEQAIPANSLGRKYVTTPFKANSTLPGYTCRIVSTEDTNDVYINGTFAYTLYKGYSKYIVSQIEPIYIESVKPIMVVQYTQSSNCAAGTGDPSMVILPSVEQFTKRANYVAPNFSEFKEHNINIVVKTTSTGNLYINGTNVASTQFVLVDSCPKFSYVSIAISPGINNFVESDSGFIMVGYGYGSKVAYSQMGGCNFRPLTFDIDVQGIACGNLALSMATTGDTDAIVKSYWNFGDGTKDSGISVAKTYINHGTYSVTNTIIYTDRNNDLHYDTLQSTVKTLPKPVAKITPVYTDSCLRHNLFMLADKSLYPNAAKTNAVWMFSDTTLTYTKTDTLKRVYGKPSITADTTIINTITLVVANTSYCYDTAIYKATIYPSVNANFTIINYQCYNGNKLEPVQLSNVDFPGYIKGYRWDFGDGTTDTATWPTKTYTDSVNYHMVWLIAYDSTAGCHDTANANFILLPSPIVNFTLANVCNGDSVAIKNTSTIKNGTLTYKWEYGNGVTDNIVTQNYLYADTGKYVVKLTATSDQFCVDSAQKTVSVFAKPQAEFLVKNIACAQNSVDFIDNTLRHNTTVQKNVWSFGDGNSTTNVGNALHTYAAQGSVNVKLLTVSTDGCADSTAQQLLINPLPTVDFVVNDSEQCLKGNVFTAASNSFVPGGGLKQLSWYVDNSLVGTGSYKELSLPAYGTNKLKLIVTSDSLCKDSVIKTLTVNPQANLDVLVNDSIQCLGSNLFAFSNISTIASGSLSYKWNLSTGDVITTTDIPPKTFNAQGLYWVQLISTSDKGCVDTLDEYVRVEYSPKVEFIPITVCENDSAVFYNTSEGGAGGWIWDLGDGTYSNAKDPVHLYAGAGIYRVRLIGESANGCSDTAVSDTGVVVFPAPKVYFTSEVFDNQEGITKVQFTNKTMYGSNYSWTFGNGNSSRDINPLELYTDTGYYRVSLSAINNFNCYDDFDTVLHIAPDFSIYIPNAFTPNKDPLNKVFKVEGTLYYQTFSMFIYNRWGELMFYSTDPLVGWDGNYKGEPVPEGVYSYVVQIADIKSIIRDYKGSIHLFR